MPNADARKVRNYVGSDQCSPMFTLFAGDDMFDEPFSVALPSDYDYGTRVPTSRPKFVSARSPILPSTPYMKNAFRSPIRLDEDGMYDPEVVSRHSNNTAMTYLKGKLYGYQLEGVKFMISREDPPSHLGEWEGVVYDVFDLW